MKHNQEYSSRFRILKGGKISLVVSALLGGVTLSFAAPTSGVVTSGVANISQNGLVTNITQSTNKASINWQKFNISANETVNFKQPDVNSITLNRVIGNERSVINGALNANGQVWLLNSNGVLFGKGARVNTAGLLATTKNITDTDFIAGKYNFKGESTASIINLGEIDITNSGYATLLANRVTNEGTIRAIRGSVHLVGANEVTINLNGNSIVDLRVDKGVLDALVENKGAVYADGGEIYLTTNAVNELLKGVVNNTGIIEANSLDGITGHVELFAHGGTATIAGNINATDGFVETSADKVKIDDSFRVKADKWLIDPNDFTIASSDGDISGATLSENLATATVTIYSLNGLKEGNGNIYVNDEISWNSNKTLGLVADNDIFINKDITATTGKITLLYGQQAVNAENTSNYHVNAKVNLQAGDNFFTKLGSDGASTIWTVVTDATAMQAMILNDATKNYALGTDLTLTGENNWAPIGSTYSDNFRGKFDGLGHSVSNLHKVATTDHLGLFGYTNGATIKNIGVVNADFSGVNYVAALVGSADNSIIENSYATGGKIQGSTQRIGGLVGNSFQSSVKNSYATNKVTGGGYVGGLVGKNYQGTIENSYATGEVVGYGTGTGGLVGDDVGTIKNSYATGKVTGTDKVGGLIGAFYDATIENSYATGEVVTTYSATSVGGLVGENSNNKPITNSFYNTSTSGQTVGVGGSGAAQTGVTGKTTAQMQDIATFSGAAWSIEEDSTLDKATPILAWQNSGNSYTTTWVIGTKETAPDPVDPDPKPDPTPPSPDPVVPDPVVPDPIDPKPEPIKPDPVKPSTKEDVKKIITSITNNEATKFTPPKVEVNTPVQNLNVESFVGENKVLVSKPMQGQATTRVSLSEAREMQADSGVVSSEVRVKLSQNSIIELVDGGVKLPDGVEQEFYVAEGN